MKYFLLTAASVMAMLLLSMNLFALNQIPGSQNVYLGYGVDQLSLGYTGISELGSLDGNSYNPASLGDLRRIANSLSLGGLGSEDLLVSAGFAYPTGFGVLSINGIYLSDSAPASLSSLAGLQLNLAKPITENLFWGIDVKYNSGMFTNTSDWQLGGDMGIILREKTEGGGFGFFDPSYGIVLKNLGKTIQLDSYDPFPAMGIGGGVSFYPIKYDAYKLKLIGDAVFPVNPFNAVLDCGIENTFFDFLKIRAGYALSDPSIGITGIGPFQLGVALTGKIAYDETNFKPENLQVKSANARLDNSTDVELAYALQQQAFNGRYELAHFVTVSIAWGYFSTLKPDLMLKPDFTYISPNSQSTQGEVRFSLDIKDRVLIEGWTLEIKDKDGKIVKVFKSLDKLQIRMLTPGKFLNQIFSAKQQVEIPKEIVWDGHDESGAKLPDGEYYYTLKAWDENNNTGETDPGRIVIDTAVPKVEPSVPYFVFSINKESYKQQLPIDIKSSNVGNGVKIHAAIIDAKNGEVKTFDFENSCPERIIWDGHDGHNSIAPEGSYSFSIRACDLAGNRSEKSIAGIRLVTNYESIKVTASDEIFSPNKNGIKDTVTFHQKASGTRGLEEWSLKIYDGNTNIVKEFAGSNDLPEEIVWDGKDRKNSVVTDGIYSYDTGLIFDSGNHPVSERKNIRVKTIPPFIVIKPEYMSFSPNNTETRNSIVFDNTVEGDDDDVIDIKIIDSSGSVVYYNTYQKKDFPDKFIWNGRDKDLRPLPEGKYTYIVEGVDKVGNRNSKQIDGIVLKTGLEKVAVQADLNAFSPKNSVSNKIVFTPMVTSRENIVDFNLSIYDDKNNLVKSVSTNIFMNKIEWDGTDNSKALARDGNYSYQLRIKYDYGNELSSAARNVKLLTKAPEITITPDYTAFSPNGSGKRETLIIHQHVGEDPDIVYYAAIIDRNERQVRSYKWGGTGSSGVPRELVWDGTDEKGAPAAEGIYSYEITGIDVAGNKTVRTINRIKLVRTFEKLVFASDTKAFSPNSGGIKDTVKFTQSLSSTDGLEESILTIYDSTGNRVRQFIKKDGLDREIIWDGRNDRGNIQPDGIYNAELECSFDSGNDIKSGISNIIIDKVPPAYKLSVSPDLFTPDGAGENEILYINLEVSALAGIKNWEIDINKKFENGEKGRVFKRFEGTNDTASLLQWDGYSDDGQDLVESVQDYILELKAEDNAGNKLTNVTREIHVGVLVEKTPEGLRIRVSSIQFAFDKADLIGNSIENLDRVIFIIRKVLSDPKKYGITDNYRIEISGHADDIGTDQYNQVLSEKRAYTVYQYFLMKDIDPRILTYAGYGKTRPYKIVTPDMPKDKRDEYRARNRRVEFFIKK